LHIEKDGSLNQVRVARSSGHKVLDDNARQTIQNIGRIQVASNLTIQAADTEIEVLYRLTD
jgi:TonB family protein